jgi:hypothetical protein
MSSATAELSSGIVEINQAVTHLDQVTQQNAALVEQSAVASDSLGRQTARLVQAVTAFAAGTATPAARPGVAPPALAASPPADLDPTPAFATLQGAHALCRRGRTAKRSIPNRDRDETTSPRQI